MSERIPVFDRWGRHVADLYFRNDFGLIGLLLLGIPVLTIFLTLKTFDFTLKGFRAARQGNLPKAAAYLAIPGFLFVVGYGTMFSVIYGDVVASSEARQEEKVVQMELEQAESLKSEPEKYITFGATEEFANVADCSLRACNFDDFNRFTNFGEYEVSNLTSLLSFTLSSPNSPCVIDDTELKPGETQRFICINQQITDGTWETMPVCVLLENRDTHLTKEFCVEPFNGYEEDTLANSFEIQGWVTTVSYTRSDTHVSIKNLSDEWVIHGRLLIPNETTLDEFKISPGKERVIDYNYDLSNRGRKICAELSSRGYPFVDTTCDDFPP